MDLEADDQAVIDEQSGAYQVLDELEKSLSIPMSKPKAAPPTEEVETVPAETYRLLGWERPTGWEDPSYPPLLLVHRARGTHGFVVELPHRRWHGMIGPLSPHHPLLGMYLDIANRDDNEGESIFEPGTADPGVE